MKNAVLPRFVVLEMIRDIAAEEEKGGHFFAAQFHKIYLHRYENVSILFADIKGFTGAPTCCYFRLLTFFSKELLQRRVGSFESVFKFRGRLRYQQEYPGRGFIHLVDQITPVSRLIVTIYFL
jgi:hypothetical protein